MNIKPKTGVRNYAKGGPVRGYSLGGIVGGVVSGAMREEAAEELQDELYGVKNRAERQEIQEEHAEGESAVGGIVSGQLHKALRPQRSYRGGGGGGGSGDNGMGEINPGQENLGQSNLGQSNRGQDNFGQNYRRGGPVKKGTR